MAAAAVLKKSKNHHISAEVWPILTKFGTAAQFGNLSRLIVKILQFKNPRRRRPPSWKVEKSPYLGDGWTYRHEIWHADAVWPAWSYSLENRAQVVALLVDLFMRLISRVHFQTIRCTEWQENLLKSSNKTANIYVKIQFIHSIHC